MKKHLKRIFAATLSAAMLFSCVYANDGAAAESPAAQEDNLAKKEKIKPEEYEHLTTTKLTPYLTNYHITTANHIKAGIKGGENFQIVRAIAISDSNPNNMIKGTDTSAIYYSHDRGVNWHPAKSGVGEYVVALGFYPWDDNLCFALFTATYGTMNLGGFYRSEDAGENWELVVPFKIGKRNCDIDIEFGEKDPVTGNYAIYIANAQQDGTMSGIYKSVDKGFSFTAMGPAVEGNVTARDTYAEIESGRVIFIPNTISADGKGGDMGTTAGSGERVKGRYYISEDSGKTWSTEEPKELEGLYLDAIAVDHSDRNIWMIATRNPSAETESEKRIKFWRTEDSGKTWTKVDPGNMIEPGDKFGINSGASVRQLKYTYPDESGKKALVAMCGEIDRPGRVSFDDGKTWKRIPDSELDVLNWGRKIDYYGTSIGMTRGDPGLIVEEFQLSNDFGETWHWSNSGMSGMACFAFEFDKNGDLRFTGAADMGATRMLDDDFEGPFKPAELVSSVGVFVYEDFATDPNDPEHVFMIGGASSTNSCLIESFDGFDTATAYKDMHDALIEKGVKLREVWYGKQNPNLVYTTWFISEDNGKTWNWTSRPVYASSPFDDDVLYSFDNVTYFTSHLFISRDRGKTWIDTDIVVDFTSDLKAVQADKFEPYVLWVGSHKASVTALTRIDLKTNEVKVFNEANGLELRGGTSLYIAHVTQSNLNKDYMAVATSDFYGGKHPTYITYDGGETWHTIEGLGEFGESGVDFSPTRNELYIGGHQGIMVLDFDGYVEYLKSKEQNK